MKRTLISTKAIDALNKAANTELANHIFYQSAANFCQENGYFGAEKFFRSESMEEHKHYLDVVNFMNSRGCCTKIAAIQAPGEEFAGLMDVLKKAFDSEVETEDLYKELANEYGDDAVVLKFALDVLEHQYQSTGEYADLIARLEIIKDDPCGLLIFDKELGDK